MIRALQQKVVAMQQEDASHSATRGDDQGLRRDHDHRLVKAGASDGQQSIAGRSATSATPAGSCCSTRPRCAATAASQDVKVSSNSWEYTGDGHALALLPGPLLNMEFVQFHPTHMVWPTRCRPARHRVVPVTAAS